MTVGSQPRHIIISHVYSSDNKGDAALTSVLIRDLRQQFPRAHIHIATLDFVQTGQTFESVALHPSFMFWALNKYAHPMAKLVYTLGMIITTLLWAIWYRATRREYWLPPELRQVATLYAQADVIVAVGGGYLRSRKGLVNRLNVPLLLHPLLFGWLLGKPTVLYSQSIGPFVHHYERLLSGLVLRHMRLIMVREDTSLKLLRHMGVTANVVRSVDAGFLLPTRDKVDLRKKFHIPSDRLLIGVTVRAWLSPAAQADYERAVAEALDKAIVQFNAHVIFIPQVTAAKDDDDRQTAERVYRLMRHPAAVTLITDELDHHAIKSLYNGLDLLLGTRFHSVIFSLTSFVPVVAIEYEHKTSGIMHDLHLDEWVIAIEAVTSHKLSVLLRELIRRQETYRTHLHQYLPGYIEQAKQAITLLAAAIE